MLFKGFILFLALIAIFLSGAEPLVQFWKGNYREPLCDVWQYIEFGQ